MQADATAGASGRLLIGIDIGGTSLKGAVVDAGHGGVLHRETAQLPTNALDRTPDRVVAMLDGMLTRLVHAAGAARADVAALGIGCPGLIRGGVVHAAGNFPSWKEVNLVAELAALLPRGARLAVVNDANAAALAEAWVGVGRGVPAPSIVVVSLGTGIGVGALVDGRLLGGNVEGGHMIIHANGRGCACGQRGCFEAYCSAPAIAARANEALSRQQLPLLSSLRPSPGRALACADVFDAAHADDALCAALRAEVVQDLALGCLNLCRLLDPHALVLAGGVSGAGARLVDPLRAELERIWWGMGAMPSVAVAHAGDMCGAVGAAAAARRCLASDAAASL